MRVLGLDPSMRQYGWVLIDTDKTGKKRVLDRGRWGTSPKDLLVDRYVELRETLRQGVRDLNPDFVGVESPAYGEQWSEGMFALFMYTQEALKAEGQDVVFLSAGQCKARARRFLGRPEKPKKWKMGKPDMVEAAALLTKGGRWNHNEADALWVAEVAARFWQFYTKEIEDTDLDDIEQELFARVHTFKRGKREGETERTGLIFREGDRFFRWSVQDGEEEDIQEDE